jgi:hypothetical protein
MIVVLSLLILYIEEKKLKFGENPPLTHPFPRPILGWKGNFLLKELYKYSILMLEYQH